MTLAEASRQYQIALEHIRTTIDRGIDEDDDSHALIDADRAMEIAWLEYHATSCTGPNTVPSPQSPSTGTPSSTTS